MALKVSTDFPYGNADAITVSTKGDMPEIRFSPASHGGAQALWFCFRIRETEPGAVSSTKVRIILEHFGNVFGAQSPADLVPVYRPGGQGWYRTSSGTALPQPDGQTSVSWLIPYPAPGMEVALCYPYGWPDVKALLSKSKGYWKADTIGQSQGGRPLIRVANDYGASGGARHGLYLVARQHAGETPGSWVLDGLLQYLSRIRKDPFLTWALPLADADGVAHGHYGKDGFPCDLDCAWGSPPTRHEAHVYQHDIARWRERCQPLLGLDFHSPGACDTSGIHCYLPSSERAPEMHGAATKWANVIAQELGAEYAAEDFKRTVSEPPRSETPTFTSYFSETLGICALTLVAPYAKIGSTTLAQKHYREAGERIALALMKRHR